MVVSCDRILCECEQDAVHRSSQVLPTLRICWKRSMGFWIEDVLLCEPISCRDFGAWRLGRMEVIRIQFRRALDSIHLRSSVFWRVLAFRFRILGGKERSRGISDSVTANGERTSQKAVDFSFFASNTLRTDGAGHEPSVGKLDERHHTFCGSCATNTDHSGSHHYSTVVSSNNGRNVVWEYLTATPSDIDSVLLRRGLYVPVNWG